MKKINLKFEITWSLIFNIFSVLISIGFISYLTKVLPIDDFGRYQLFIAYIGIVGIFSLKGNNVVINKNLLAGKDYVFNNTFWQTYKNVIKIFIALLTLCAVLSIFYSNEKIHLFLIAILFLPLLGLEKYDPILYAKQKFITLRIFNLINITLYALFAIALYEYTNNYLYIFFSMFFVKAVVIWFGLRYAISLLHDNGKKYQSNSRSELKEGYKLSLLTFYNVGVSHIDKLIIGFIDFRLLAIYSIGVLIPLRVKDQLKLVLNVLLQNWGKAGEATYASNVIKYNKYIFLLSSLLFLIITSTSYLYIPILFNENYMEGEKVLWIISASIPLILSSFIFESYIIFFHNTDFYQKVTYSKQIVYLIALSLLTPFFDILGVASAFLIRCMYDYSLNYVYYYKYTNKAVGE